MHEYITYNTYQNRTAGSAVNAVKSVQSWKTPKIPQGEAQKEIVANLDQAAKNSFDDEVRTALSYAPQRYEHQQLEDSFSFGDVVDVVNPLQHLPVVGMVYRQLTGDDIRPMSQIVGGALYGGPIGAVTGTVNAISRVQTGKDVAEHALDFTRGTMFEKPDRTVSWERNSSVISDLPETVIAAVDLSVPVI